MPPVAPNCAEPDWIGALVAESVSTISEAFDASVQSSVGMVITYADTARIRHPMGPLEKLNGNALGTQKDYKNTMGTELVKGVELALAELGKAKSPIKVLIVLTDGNDTNNDAARAKLALLKKQAATDGVRTFAIVYKAALSGSGNVINNLTPQVSTVATTENLAASLRAILQRIADRQYLTFPGFRKDAKVGFQWDGKPHDLVLKIDQAETEPQAVVLAPKWAP